MPYKIISDLFGAAVERHILDRSFEPCAVTAVRPRRRKSGRVEFVSGKRPKLKFSLRSPVRPQYIVIVKPKAARIPFISVPVSRRTGDLLFVALMENDDGRQEYCVSYSAEGRAQKIESRFQGWKQLYFIAIRPLQTSSSVAA